MQPFSNRSAVTRLYGCCMSDAVFARMDRAINQSYVERAQRRLLSEEGEEAIRRLRRSILESASAPSETRARRENRARSEAG
jgi:hypothetical protein